MITTIKRLFRWINGKKPTIPPILLTSMNDSWFKIGCPEKIGYKILTRMQSGKDAVFLLAHVSQYTNNDCINCRFEFSHFKTWNEPEYPRL